MARPLFDSTLLNRLLDAQPLANLIEIRSQIQADLRDLHEKSVVLQRDLGEVQRVIAERDAEPDERPASETVSANGLRPSLPLRRAVLTVLREEPAFWTVEGLLTELRSRGWAPGGKNPRNTLVSRLSEMIRGGVVQK